MYGRRSGGAPPDPVTLLLTNQNVDLQRQVTDLRRELESARKENELLWKAMERPSVSSMNEQQIHMLAELLWAHIMGFPIKEEKKSS
jgi:hypothetical protein